MVSGSVLSTTAALGSLFAGLAIERNSVVVQSLPLAWSVFWWGVFLSVALSAFLGSVSLAIRRLSMIEAVVHFAFFAILFGAQFIVASWLAGRWEIVGLVLIITVGLISAVLLYKTDTERVIRVISD